MSDLITQMFALYRNIKKDLENAHTMHNIESVREQYFGKKGYLTEFTKQFKNLSSEERKHIGSDFQNIKKNCLDTFAQQKERIAINAYQVPAQNFFDPAFNKGIPEQGSLHLYTHIIREVEDIFISMGFEIVEGPTIEDDHHNFAALNIPDNHPAKDTHDTFWLDLPDKLLRTHTSTVQIREGEKKTPPFCIVAPGRVYRNEATDSSHDFMFWQCELLFVSQEASIANLLYVIETFLQKLFYKKNIAIRTRPSHFPFVEPGLEVDMTCPFCSSGCSTCKKTKWIEMGGAGMVHPSVLRSINIDPEEYRGFAFGFGLTRLTMLKHHISDIRLLHQPSISK